MLKMLHGCMLLHLGLGYQMLERILLLKVLIHLCGILSRFCSFILFYFLLLLLLLCFFFFFWFFKSNDWLWSDHPCSLGTKPAGYIADRIFAPYSVYKGKAALSVTPVLPTFTKLDVWLFFWLLLQLFKSYFCGVELCLSSFIYFLLHSLVLL